MPVVLAIARLGGGCSSSSSRGVELSVHRGDATGDYAGTYIGTLTVHSTADLAGGSSGIDDRTEAAVVEVSRDGLVQLKIDTVTILGVVSNTGEWGVRASINNFETMINVTYFDRLDDAGCSMTDKTAKIGGQVSPPDMAGKVSGQLICKRAGITLATLTTSGQLRASR
ncbi:MAG: hypothetical protein VX249_05075 [Pseudomonadota bacterium]|nr:hypothetical protein [Pseudomonadota bacterium]